MRIHDPSTRRPRRAARRAAAVAALALLAACDFKVTNPGPVETKFLDDPAAAPAIVNGAGRDLSDALNWIAYTGAAIAREIFPAGSTGSFGITVLQQTGKLVEEESGPYWNRAQRARYEADAGIAHLRKSLPDFG